MVLPVCLSVSSAEIVGHLIAGKPLSAHRELIDFGPRGESQFEPMMSFRVERKAVTGRINACRNVPF